VPESAATHFAAIEVTDGLETAVVCDGGTSRLGRGERAPRRVDDPEDLLADPDVDLVVVATVANTRGEWAARALQAGKSVVVDAPACLTTSEADELNRLASARSLLLAAFPDRGDDPSFQAVHAAVRAGSIGDVLWAETFQGGWNRPAGSWHDDQRVSGGLLFDRGYAHVSWLLDL
nr:Gfo/Idh/MocA family oxidoreductase [Micromonospora sp. DSM 115978]